MPRTPARRRCAGRRSAPTAAAPACRREKRPSEGEIHPLPNGDRAFAPDAEPDRGSPKTVNEGTANCFI